MPILRSLFERREFSYARWANWLDSRYETQGGAVSEHEAFGLSAVWGCVRVRSEDMAKLPLRSWQRVGDDDRLPARNHWLHQIFSVQTNPYMVPYVFRQLMSKCLAVRGNAYAVIDRDELGNVTALWPRSPLYMQPTVIDGRLIYRYQGTFQRDYQPEEIFHLKGMTDDGIIGLSPLEVFSQGTNLALSQQNQVQKSMDNGVRTPYAIKVQPDVNPENAKKLGIDYNAVYGGPAGTGKVPFLYGGMEPVPLGFSSKDAEILESRRFSVEEFCRIWRVPPYKVMDFLRATFNNITETNISVVNDTLLPEQVMWEQTIHMQLLMPHERNVYYVEHDNYDLLKGTPMERADIECKYVQGGISQINEVRRSHNWPAVEGGDESYMQEQMVPIKDAGKRLQVKLQQKGGASNEIQPGA